MTVIALISNEHSINLVLPWVSTFTQALRTSLTIVCWDTELIVAAANDPTGVTGATYPPNPLLKDSPCNTVVLFGDSSRSTEPRRIMVAATDNMKDIASLFLTSRMIDSHDARLSLARTEFETEHVALEVDVVN